MFIGLFNGFLKTFPKSRRLEVEKSIEKPPRFDDEKRWFFCVGLFFEYDSRTLLTKSVGSVFSIFTCLEDPAICTESIYPLFFEASLLNYLHTHPTTNTNSTIYI